MLFLGIILGLAAIVWLTVLLRQGGPWLTSLLVILCGSVFGHPFFHVSVLTSDRGLFLILVAMYGYARWRGQWPTRRLTRHDGLMALFLGWLALNTLLHDWRIDGGQPLSRFLFLFAMPAGMYWIGRETHLDVKRLQTLWWGGVAFGAYLAFTAMAEVTNLYALVFPRYMVSPEYPEFLGRGRGPFLNPSANGIYLTTALGCAAACWSTVSRSRRPVVAVLAGLIVLGAVATLTRCVWLGVFLAVGLWCHLHLPTTRKIGLSVLVGSLAIVFVSVAWDNLSAFKRDKNVSVADMAQSAKLRPMLAYVAWEMFWDHPLAGVGLGQYKHADAPYIAARSVDLPLDQIRPYHQHNVFLSILTETGLLGLVPFIGLLIGWSRSAWALGRDDRLPPAYRAVGVVFLFSLSGYFANGMFQDVALIPMVNLLVFFLGGLVVSASIEHGLLRPLNLDLGPWLNLVTRVARPQARNSAHA